MSRQWVRRFQHQVRFRVATQEAIRLFPAKIPQRASSLVFHLTRNHHRVCRASMLVMTHNLTWQNRTVNASPHHPDGSCAKLRDAPEVGNWTAGAKHVSSQDYYSKAEGVLAAGKSQLRLLLGGWSS